MVKKRHFIVWPDEGIPKIYGYYYSKMKVYDYIMFDF